MKSVTTMEDLFLHNLKDIYHAEKQLLKALPKMAKAASSEELRAAFEEHLQETEHQVERLEQVFQILDVAARGVKCAAMEGLVEEGSEVIDASMDAAVKDAALIGAANKVEHYEIATYGTLCSYAKQLGYDEALELLMATLEEEKAADRKLTELAESDINLQVETEE
jgi:ferritin-like metal-binding protein YciE